MHGFGKKYWENGHLLYEGLFKENVFHGLGKVFNNQGEIRYEGNSTDGKPNGEG